MKTRVILFDAFKRDASSLEVAVVDNLLKGSRTCTITCGEKPYLIGKSVEDLVSKISQTHDHQNLKEDYTFID
jgi:hypothetical protein